MHPPSLHHNSHHTNTSHPSSIFGLRIITWATPLLTLAIWWLLFPAASLLGHICGVAIGYAYAYKYLARLDPPEWLLQKIEHTWAHFIIRRVPFYVSLESRNERMYSFLPTSEAPGVVAGGVTMRPPPSQGASPGPAAFAGPGRALGL